MTIQVGDAVPSVTLRHLTGDGMADLSTDDVFRDRTVVVFGVPGAFTPTCSGKHLPGFIANASSSRPISPPPSRASATLCSRTARCQARPRS